MKRLLTAALLSVSSLALAQGGELPAGHPPIPPGTGASPARPGSGPG